MKYLSFLAPLILTVGCSSSGSSSPKTAPRGGENPRESEQKAEIRSRLNAKRQELAQVDGDLQKIAAERQQLSEQGSSEAKTNRLVELARLESDAKLHKGAVTEEIAQLQQQLSGSSSSSATNRPGKAGDALDELLAGNEFKEKEEAERRKKRAEEEAATDKVRIAQAEAARIAELAEREKQKVEGGRLTGGAEGAGFEDRWADVIIKVRTELQKFKRW